MMRFKRALQLLLVTLLKMATLIGLWPVMVIRKLLIAEPKMLGRVKMELGKEAHAKVIMTIAKDLEKETTKGLEEILNEFKEAEVVL